MKGVVIGVVFGLLGPEIAAVAAVVGIAMMTHAVLTSDDPAYTLGNLAGGTLAGLPGGILGGGAGSMLRTAVSRLNWMNYSVDQSIVSSGMPIMKYNSPFSNSQNITHRAVTPQQANMITAGEGIVKPIPAHQATPTQQVGGTIHSRNPWTSTTRSYEVAEYYSTRGGTEPANPIIRIDLNKIRPEAIFDVSNIEKAARLTTPFTRNVAAAHEKVLIHGNIPPEAIRFSQ